MQSRSLSFWQRHSFWRTIHCTHLSITMAHKEHSHPGLKHSGTNAEQMQETAICYTLSKHGHEWCFVGIYQEWTMQRQSEEEDLIGWDIHPVHMKQGVWTTVAVNCLLKAIEMMDYYRVDFSGQYCKEDGCRKKSFSSMFSYGMQTGPSMAPNSLAADMVWRRAAENWNYMTIWISLMWKWMIE